MRQILAISQEPQESVTDYVVRLEKIFSTIRENYPQDLVMVDRPQHLRERFYQGLRKELHQKITPFYRDSSIPYMQLLRMAREIEGEMWTTEDHQAKGARELDPQVQEVVEVLKSLKEQVERTVEHPPAKRLETKWKGLYSCYHCKEPGHWRRNCPKRDHRRGKPTSRGGLSQTSSQKAEQPESTDDTSQPSTQETRRPVKKKKLSATPQYYNPDPVARMFGRANEAKVEVNGISTTCLVDTGATVTIVNEGFCGQAGLRIHPLDQLVTISAMGGTPIPYLGYAVATLEFPHIPNFSEEVVMLVISDTTDYAERVPLQIGTRVIAAVTETLTPEDIKHLDETWKQTYVGTLMSCAAQQKQNSDGDPFDLDKVKGPVKLRKGAELGPFEQVEVWGYTQVKGHSKRVVVCTDSEELLMKGQVMSVSSKSELLPHNSRVKVMLRNLSAKSVKVPAKTTLGEVSACNVVPPIWGPEPEAVPEKTDTEKPWTKEMQDLFEQLGLNEPKDWMTEEDVLEAKRLVQKFHTIFSKHDLDLGKTYQVKYKIKLTDSTPFKERYRRIPPSQYEAVRKHLQEMLDIGAIRPSDSPWCSAVVLVKKKNGELRFCIDLRKLNMRTIKDAYNLPRIDETLERLKGSCVFSSLDLKSGYWQVEIEEESKQYTAFTLGPLGFYECNRMPFGATNAPATFQRLMESCLGDLNLNWCIIYLDDVVVYAPTVEEHLKRLEGVFQKLKDAGLKLKPSKCELFKKSISYLGHVVSEDGIHTDPKKI